MKTQRLHNLLIVSLALLVFALVLLSAPPVVAQGPTGNIWGYPVRCRAGIGGGENCIQIYNGKNIALYSNAGTTRTIDLDGATGYISSERVIAASLELNGDLFSGVTKYGKVTSYISGTSITHGFEATATVCLMSPMPITATVTITETGFSTNWTTSNPIMWMCGQ